MITFMSTTHDRDATRIEIMQLALRIANELISNGSMNAHPEQWEEIIFEECVEQVEGYLHARGEASDDVLDHDGLRDNIVEAVTGLINLSTLSVC